ncbi:MAG TPA: ABC transporter permease [Acidobacteriota bacterium]|nr:ABC transporter permease [Acidobacteriota bacterium]
MREIRFLLRSFRSNPIYAMASILTVALGLSGAVAVFSVLDEVLLQPLPYRESERLVMVWNDNRNIGMDRYPISYPDFLDLCSRSKSLQDSAAVIGFEWSAILSGTPEPRRAAVQFVSGSFFPMMGVEAALGRALGPADDRREAPLTILISHHLWTEQFGSDPEIVGTTLSLDGKSAEIAGVLPPGFRFFEESDLWAPLAHNPNARRNRRFHHWLRVVGRLAPGVTLQQASDDLKTIAAGLEEEHPQTNEGIGLRAVSLEREVRGDWRLSLLMLAGAVLCTLLIACANLASLMSSRTAGREGEIALRRSLGATPPRLVGRILNEGLVLGTVGGALGLLMAFWIVRLLRAFGPSDLPRLSQVYIGWRTLLFAAAAVALVSVVSCLPACLRIWTGDTPRPLKGQHLAGVRSELRLQRWIISAQMALALTLLVPAGLLLRSLDHLSQAQLGFQPRHLLTFKLHLPSYKYDDDAKRLRFARRMLEELRTLPGVEALAVSRDLPFRGRGSTRIELEGGSDTTNQDTEVDFRGVSPDYFRAMGITLVRGRPLSDHTGDRDREVVVNRAAARLLWKGRDALGRGLRFAGASSDSPWWRVVGIAEDVRHGGAAAPPYPEVYFPLETDPPANPWVVVRSESDAAAALDLLQSTARSLDRDLVVDDASPMQAKILHTLLPYRFYTFLVVVFAALASTLSLIGIYGVASQSVARRRREIGIRTALGGTPPVILGGLLLGEVRWTVLGLLVGVAASLAVSHLLESLLFQVGGRDVLTYAVACGTLLGASLAASTAAVRQALRTPLLAALREDR